jgi:L-ascorbate metabolism protein UlaG (beta-lactamase superfamily)
VQIRTGSATLYVDPAYPKTYHARHPTKIGYSSWPDPIDGLPEPMAAASAILVTHHHKDHVKRVTVDRLRQRHTAVFAPRLCARELGDGFTAVSEGDEFARAGFAVRVVPAYNTEAGSSTKKIHKKGQCVGYLVSAGKTRIYPPGDTDLIPEMLELGPVDVAFLPIGGTYTMNTAEAAEAALAIVPRRHTQRRATS